MLLEDHHGPRVVAPVGEMSSTQSRPVLQHSTAHCSTVTSSTCRKTDPSRWCRGPHRRTSSSPEFSRWWDSINSSMFPTSCLYSVSDTLNTNFNLAMWSAKSRIDNIWTQFSPSQHKLIL